MTLLWERSNICLWVWLHMASGFLGASVMMSTQVPSRTNTIGNSIGDELSWGAIKVDEIMRINPGKTTRHARCLWCRKSPTSHANMTFIQFCCFTRKGHTRFTATKPFNWLPRNLASSDLNLYFRCLLRCLSIWRIRRFSFKKACTGAGAKETWTAGNNLPLRSKCSSGIVPCPGQT